ncbi:MAG: hypothetical protein QF444_00750 [Phycisphaerales bacterium]|jgi:bacterioferritin-associated ferredoxin|nr:hypothetical protein [Phycisphaerales bacterium]MDP6692828.1 hypothetical protein [Phycisphaerales bacterium]
MKPEDYICVCHRVPLCKLQNFIKREKPVVTSQLSNCLGAGTACGWCIPFLEKIHRQYKTGKTMVLTVDFDSYSERRNVFNAKKSEHKDNDD